MILHSDLRRRAASRRALPCPSSYLFHTSFHLHVPGQTPLSPRCCSECDPSSQPNYAPITFPALLHTPPPVTVNPAYDAALAAVVTPSDLLPYTGWPKNGTIFVGLRLNDFHNYFTVKIRRNFVIILSLKIPPHLKCVATLPRMPGGGVHSLGVFPSSFLSIHSYPVISCRLIDRLINLMTMPPAWCAVCEQFCPPLCQVTATTAAAASTVMYSVDVLCERYYSVCRGSAVGLSPESEIMSCDVRLSAAMIFRLILVVLALCHFSGKTNAVSAFNARISSHKQTLHEQYCC